MWLLLGLEAVLFPCALLRLLPNTLWSSYLEFLISRQSKHTSAAKLQL